MVKISTERRQAIRAKRVLSIQYRLLKSRSVILDKSWHLSTTQDMSIGGLTFYTECEYRIGDIVELHVVMSGVLDIFSGSARVLRIEKKKNGAFQLVAVKFIESKDKSRNAKSYKSLSKLKTKNLRRI